MSLLAGAAAEAAIYKCEVDGALRYQQSPCPTPGTGTDTRPTAASLNAERQKKLQAERQQASSRPAAVATTPDPGSRSAPASGFRCDGRLYCSQMSSCDEAKYFLAHCPGVKMDGDRDGRPCEDQLCGH